MDSRNISLVSRIVAYIVMIVFVVLAIYPLCWVFIQSFKTNQDYMRSSKLALPTEWFWGNYPYVWDQVGFGTFFKNSIIYSVITVIGVVLLGSMAGFAFAKLQFKITKVLHGLFIVGILLNVQSILIPLFLMVHAVGLYNTRLGILIPYIGLALPMGVYLYTDFIKMGIHTELIESAKIDGASYMRIFSSIVFPMCAPVSVTLAIITFTSTWSEFVLMNLLTAGDRLKAIPAAVGRFAGALGTNYGRLFTSLSISIIPIIVFYLIFRNQITKGVAAGAVKG